MRITGPGSGVPTPPTDDAAAERTERPAAQAESFARRLDEATAAPDAPEPVDAAARVVSPPEVQAVLADLRAGRIDAQQAVGRLVDDAVSRRVGAQAPEAVRERLRAELMDLLASDPHLGDLVKRMERKLP